jgi:hypothetical protein
MNATAVMPKISEVQMFSRSPRTWFAGSVRSASIHNLPAV